MIDVGEPAPSLDGSVLTYCLVTSGSMSRSLANFSPVKVFSLALIACFGVVEAVNANSDRHPEVSRFWIVSDTKTQTVQNTESERARLAANAERVKELATMFGAAGGVNGRAELPEAANTSSRAVLLAAYKAAAERAIAAETDLAAAEFLLLDAGMSPAELEGLGLYLTYHDFLSAEPLGKIGSRVGGMENLHPGLGAVEDLSVVEAYYSARLVFLNRTEAAHVALERAANKEITEESYAAIATEVNRLLGLDGVGQVGSGGR